MNIKEDFADLTLTDVDQRNLSDNFKLTTTSLIAQINRMIIDISGYKYSEVSKLNKQKKELEKELELHKTEFVDDITDIKVKSPKMLTLQDWIIASFMLSYLFASLCLLFYIGTKTQWNKKILALSFLILVVVSLLIYTLLHTYA
jgi:hypothetical protein